MSDRRVCLSCGVNLSADATHGLCSKCSIRQGVSKTVTYRPGPRSETVDSPSAGSAIDLVEFQRLIVEMGLVEAEELKRFVVTPDEVSRLAGALIRAGKLTAYQAAALSQGKAKGLLIGDYLILEKLGAGGMGVVFKARHCPTGHIVALKVLPPSFGHDAEAVQRFRREVEIAARLDHPNVVAALDASAFQGVQYLAMEYISGHDLDRLVADGGPLPVELALHCTIHAARGLAAAHAQGIIHRDVKPANVMLDGQSCVRVLDLGLARVVEAGNLVGGSPLGSLTQSGTYMGTVDFMAPEQADDPRKVDHRADIYSLGCTLYFLLTARPPFLGDTVLKRLMAHQERPAPSLRLARSEVSEKLEAVYLEMMAKRPMERPDSMADVIDLLEACRVSSENEEEARNGLTIFAKRALKRATPRGRDRGTDASIFARRPKTAGFQFDPDLRFEDVVMDLREEKPPQSLADEKLPPRPRRVAPPRRRTRRGSPALVLVGAIGLGGLGAAGYLLNTRTGPTPVRTPALSSSHPDGHDPALVANISGSDENQDKKISVKIDPKVDEEVGELRRDLKDKSKAKAAERALGEMLRQDGPGSPVLTAWLRQLEREESTGYGYANLAIQLLIADRKDDALTVAKRAVRLSPRSAWPHFCLGMAYVEHRAWDLAADEFRETVRLNPERSDAHHNLASVIITNIAPQRRDLNEALLHARKAVELAPKTGRFHSTLCLAEYRAGNLDRALSAEENSRKFNSGAGAYDWFVLAMIYYKKRDVAEANRWFEKAVSDAKEKVSTDRDLHDLWAEAAALLGRTEPVPATKE